MEKTPSVHVPDVDFLGLGLITFSTGFPVLDIILGLIPILFYLFVRTLEGDIWRGRMQAFITDGSWSLAYAGLLEQARIAMDTFFGPPWSRRAFDMCFRLALAYASLHILVRDAGPALSQSFVRVVLCLALIGAGFFAARAVQQRLRAGPGTIAREGRETLTYAAFWLGILAVERAGVPDIYLLMLLIGAALGAGVALAVPVAVLGFLSYLAGIRFGGTCFVYLAMFPLVNALFDWPSWAATRWLIGRLRRDATLPRFRDRAAALTGHILLDVAIGVACLYGLAVTIVLMTETNVGMLMWDRTFSQGLAEPLSGGGLVLTIMILSTLVPTCLHILFALFALALIEMPGRLWFARWLDPEPGAQEWASRAIVAAFLTLCAIFALAIFWIGVEGGLAGLAALWQALGWAGPNPDYPILSSVYQVAGIVARGLAGQ